MQSQVQCCSLFVGFRDPLKTVPSLSNGSRYMSSSVDTDPDVHLQVLGKVNLEVNVITKSTPDDSDDFIVFEQSDEEDEGEEESSDEEELPDDDSDDDESLIVFGFDTAQDDACDGKENKGSSVTNTSTPKKVKFNLKPEVHEIIHWEYAYRAARKGEWEMYARDRDRFKSRIQNIANILGPILSDQHRSHVWHERFQQQN